MNKILYTSIVKCGTHLLLRYFLKAGFKHAGPFNEIGWKESFLEFVRNLKPGEYSGWHFHWTKELSGIVKENGVKVVFLYRDPRAQISAELHFIMQTPGHTWHPYLADHLRSDRERFVRLIQGVPPNDLERFFPPAGQRGVHFFDPGPRTRPRAIPAASTSSTPFTRGGLTSRRVTRSRMRISSGQGTAATRTGRSASSKT